MVWPLHFSMIRHNKTPGRTEYEFCNESIGRLHSGSPICLILWQDRSVITDCQLDEQFYSRFPCFNYLEPIQECAFDGASCPIILYAWHVLSYYIVQLMLKSGLPMTNEIRELYYSYDKRHNDCVQKFRCHRALLFNYIYWNRGLSCLPGSTMEDKFIRASVRLDL